MAGQTNDGPPANPTALDRLARLRVAHGVPEVEARPARTTVYDAFRAGRRRLDVGLLEDVVRVLGPWWGALVGLATNTAGVVLSGPVSLAFAVVNVVGALVWGYGVRRLGPGRSIPRLFTLSVRVCTLTAAPIVLWLTSATSRDHDDRGMGTVVASLVVALVSSNLLTSLVDKVLSGFVALVAAEALLGPGWGDRLAEEGRTSQGP